MKRLTIPINAIALALLALGFAAHGQGGGAMSPLYVKKALDSLVLEHYDAATDTWGNGIRSEFCYDGCGRTTQITEYAWNPQAAGWDKNYREEYYYDPMGRMSMHIVYHWDPSGAAWQRSHKEEMDWDAFNRLWITSQYQWSEAMGQWRLTGHFVYSYDGAGLTDTVTWYHWNDGMARFDPGSMDLYAHNAAGLVEEIVYHQWNEGTGMFEPTSKYTCTWNGLGHPVLATWYLWDAPLSGFRNDHKEEFLYDFSQNVAEIYRYTWDPLTCHWVWFQKEAFGYDDTYLCKHLVLPYPYLQQHPWLFIHMLTASQSWWYNQAAWTPSHRCTYFYSNKSVSAIAETTRPAVRLWPNPASGVLYLEGPPPEGCTVTLYDLQGKTVLQEEASGHAIIPLAHLPKGPYLCRISGGNTPRFSQKVIVR